MATDWLVLHHDLAVQRERLQAPIGNVIREVVTLLLTAVILLVNEKVKEMRPE